MFLTCAVLRKQQLCSTSAGWRTSGACRGGGYFCRQDRIHGERLERVSSWRMGTRTEREVCMSQSQIGLGTKSRYLVLARLPTSAPPEVCNPVKLSVDLYHCDVIMYNSGRRRLHVSYQGFPCCAIRRSGLDGALQFRRRSWA